MGSSFIFLIFLSCLQDSQSRSRWTYRFNTKQSRAMCMQRTFSKQFINVHLFWGVGQTSQLHMLFLTTHPNRSSVHEVHFIKIFKKHTYQCIHVDKLLPLFFIWFQNQSTSCKKRRIQSFVYFYCFIFEEESVTVCSVYTIYKKNVQEININAIT